MNAETIFWYDSAEDLPDGNFSVLMYHNKNSVSQGCWTGTYWRNLVGTAPAGDPTHWAYMPKGPGK
mgnify:CR=1 FL=1